MTKTASILRRLASTLVVAGMGAGLLGSAVAGAATRQSFQISPPTANYAGDAGAAITGKVKVTNLTDSPITLKIGKENFVAKGEEGEIELVDSADPLYSLAPWFVVNTPELTVAARDTKEVSYSIAIPAAAEPGGRYGSIVFQSIPPKLPPGQSGASIQQNIAGIVFARINGAADEKLHVESFATDRSFYETGPVKLTTRLKNTGTVHEKATGTITIKNLFGWVVAKVPLDEHFVIPGSIRRLHNDWPTGSNQPFLIGRYTATLDAVYGGGQKLTASTTFTVIPWKLLAVAVLIILVAFTVFWRGRRRLGRAARILAGRD
jgi:hypothetical protein